MRNLAPWLALALAAPVAAQDELGLGKMWTFERPPLAYLEREHGFRADEAWWNRMRLASLRFGSGCSASFVSPHGLILTNHHCVRDAVAKAQGADDWVRDGYVARAEADEVRLEGLTVQQLVAMRDVTTEVAEGVSAAMAPAEAERRREANRQRLLADARSAQPDLEPQLVRLFHGGVWQLYQYRVFDDIRLVMAPHLQLAHFGGDADNFVYPRYAIDFSFCRAYVDGHPADTAACSFAWGDGPEQGELVFLTGNPGGTSRLLTVAQLDYLSVARYPRIRALIDNRIAVLRGFAHEDASLEKRLRTSILSLENGQKLYRGEHAVLQDPVFLAHKQEAEKSFRARVVAAGRGAELVVWDDLAALMHQKVALEAPLNFQSAGGLPLLIRAEKLLAWAEAPTDEQPAARQLVLEVRCGRDPVQEALFVDHLERARGALTPDDPYLKVTLGGAEPADVVARLVATSALAADDRVRALLDAGAGAVLACQDPALLLMREVRSLMVANRARWSEIAAQEAALDERLARLLFAVYGDDVSPDATFTLRFSDGRVVGYPCNGSVAPWRTVFHGMFARHAEFDGVHPFDLPEPWLLAKDRIDMQAPLDFVCTVDSTGGNSGSPVVNTRLELAGLLFDGNIESLANEFLYGERVERSVCVHPQAIVEALRKVYSATRLLRELRR